MANVKVRLKDASNNVLHPETDWSVVLNRPSFDRVANGNGYFTQRWNASAKSDDVAIDGSVVRIYASDTMLELESSEEMYLTSGATIQIRDQNTKQNYVSLNSYPIKWSAISNKPNYIPTDARNIVFGQYSTVTADSDGVGYGGMIYPAIRTIDYASTPGGDSYRYTHYYFNGTSWTKFTDASKFSPGF